MLSISPYCFGLHAVDTTIDTVNNVAFKSVCLSSNSTLSSINTHHLSPQSPARVCLITDTGKIHAKDQPAAQALQSKSSEESSSSSSDESSSKAPYVEYPAQVTINRKFEYMGRVTQPTISRSIEPIFNISDGAFGITTHGGIIYVSNVTAIQNNSTKRYVYVLN